MNREECLETMGKLIETHGVKCISKQWLNENGYKQLYGRIHSTAIKNINLGIIAKHFNCYDEYIKQKQAQQIKSCNRTVWSEEQLDQAIRDVIKKYNYFPPREFLNANGYSNLLNAMYRANITKETIVNKYGSYGTPNKNNRLICKNKLVWNSYPEAACANFLWSRGITVYKGSRYPDEYSQMSGNSYGLFDIEFIGTKGEFENKRIFVEIWGNFSGKIGERYNKKRKFKEEFNKDNKYFLGIGYKDCFKESKLITIFQPYVESSTTIRYDTESDTQMSPLVWSLYDEVIYKAKQVCHRMEDKNLPELNWFRKIKQFKDRPILDWEYELFQGSSVTFYKKMMKVGMDTIRRALELPLVRHKWTHETALETINSYTQKYSDSYDKIRKILAKKNKNNLTDLEKEQLRNAKLANSAEYWLRKMANPTH
jgi:hypothetical protein